MNKVATEKNNVNCARKGSVTNLHAPGIDTRRRRKRTSSEPVSNDR